MVVLAFWVIFFAFLSLFKIFVGREDAGYHSDVLWSLLAPSTHVYSGDRGDGHGQARGRTPEKDPGTPVLCGPLAVHVQLLRQPHHLWIYE